VRDPAARAGGVPLPLCITAPTDFLLASLSRFPRVKKTGSNAGDFDTKPDLLDFVLVRSGPGLGEGAGSVYSMNDWPPPLHSLRTITC